MKKIYLVLIALLSFIACKKNETTTTQPATITPKVDTYSFHFTFNGIDYKFDEQVPQYNTFRENYLEGYQMQVGWIQDYPIVGFRFTWPQGHKVTESDVQNLVGKKTNFNNSEVKPNMVLAFSNTANWQIDTTAITANDYIQLDKVTFLKDEVGDTLHLKVYVVTGTCSAHMVNLSTGNKGVLSNGSFYMRVSRFNN